MAVIKKAELLSLQSHVGNDKAYSKDYFEKYKHKSCWELKGGQLKCYEQDSPKNYTQTTVVTVEKRRGTNILILRCGPGGRMVNFLEFDSKRLTDEWQEAICDFTEQYYDPNPILRRVKTEIESEEMKRRRDRIRSAFADFAEMEDTTALTKEDVFESLPHTGSESPPPDLTNPTTPEDVFESKPHTGSESPPPDHVDSTSAGSGSNPQSSGEASPGSDSSDISPFSSLKSDCSDSPQLEEVDCTKDSLSQHVFEDYEDEIFVTKTIPGSKLNVGDMIDLKNAEFTKNAQGLTEYIRTTAKETIPLMVVRGVEVTVKEFEPGNITMNIRGPKISRPDIVDVIMKTYNSCTKEESRLAIAEINDMPVEAGTQNDQVEQRLRDTFMQSPEGLRIRPIPRSLMRSNDELPDDVHDDQGNGEVQDSVLEARRIDVTGADNVSSDTKPTDENEETEC